MLHLRPYTAYPNQDIVVGFTKQPRILLRYNIVFEGIVFANQALNGGDGTLKKPELLCASDKPDLLRDIDYQR